jgi:RraA family protein
MTSDRDANLARLESLTTADVGDAMDRMGVVAAAIKPVWKGARVVGPALTVLTKGGDNLLVHQALELVEPGVVVVVNGQGDESRALLGDRMAARAQERGVAGFVIDGAVRDAAALERLAMPVFSRAVSPAGPGKHGPGSLNVPVAIGGVVVFPGDIVVADGDGVVIIPQAELAAVVEAAELAALDGWHLPEPQ